MKNTLQDQFGNIDIYLFDQLLKGRFDDCKSVIDIGCGSGRNIYWFLKNNFEVFGIDQDPKRVEQVKQLSKELSTQNSTDNFRVSLVEENPFERTFDIVICNAVLHFANSKEHFEKMLYKTWDVVAPGGYFFARLASDTGIEHLVKNIGNGRYHLPDGSDRYLVNEKMLLDYTEELGGELYEPIKTTNVQSLRCMTTWCVKKK